MLNILIKQAIKNKEKMKKIKLPDYPKLCHIDDVCLHFVDKYDKSMQNNTVELVCVYA